MGKELTGEDGRFGSGSVFYWLLVQELTQHKGHRDELGVVVTVNGELLKKPPLIIFKYKPGQGNMGKEIILSNLADLLLANRFYQI